ncbi:hypothetical protein AB0K05_24880 [Nonomuraea sp. NPDC049486]|uniref:hypothetical protein n=1 Tax=Nonomuraea sp. NPDC049486 TaxID=3155773 RepID=UPI00344A6737
MTLHYVDADDQLLDTITLADGRLAYDTGAARPVLESLRARTPDGSDRGVFAALAEGGWSNGYATIRPA